MSSDDFYKEMKEQAQRAIEKKKAMEGEEKLDAVCTQADATITFRVNKALKDEFTRVCKKTTVHQVVKFNCL